MSLINIVAHFGLAIGVPSYPNKPQTGCLISPRYSTHNQIGGQHLSYIPLVIRFAHIASSVCWAGGGFIFFLFVEPTAKALAPTGMQFLQYMVTKRHFSKFMVISSSLTVLSGALIIWQRANGNWLGCVESGPGLDFTLGSAVGILVYFIGMFGVNTRAVKLAKIGNEMQASGGPPTPAQGALMQKLDREMSMLSLADFILVALSLTIMATARFWLS